MINILLDNYAPLKRIDKYKLRLKSKPRITLGLQKSISVKNKLLTNFINAKHTVLKNEIHIEYKNYRNLLSILMKKSKQVCYKKYFETKWNNVKNTLKGIKSLISLKSVTSSAPTVLFRDNGNTIITNFYNIVNTINNYCASIDETTKNNIKYPHKHFSDYLKEEYDCKIFLNFNATDRFVQPFFETGVFPSIPKTANVVPVFKKVSKLDNSKYCPISLLSNIEKILEQLMYKGLHTFLNNNNIIYNLQFGFRQHCSTSHALINITENITKALDDGSIGCRVFVDLQKAVDTGDHQILLAKLDHYGICGVSNDSFKSYLSNCNQYVSKNG